MKNIVLNLKLRAFNLEILKCKRNHIKIPQEQPKNIKIAQEQPKAQEYHLKQSIVAQEPL
jgi:sRNA-binding carbon storage regulator CsrA